MSDDLDMSDTQIIAVSLDPRTLRLLQLLSEKSQELANMLRGAWITLNTSSSPDRLPQAAHSIRELMEKAADKLPDVPVKQGTNNLKNDVKSLSERWSIVIKDRQEVASWSGAIDEPLLAMLVDFDSFFAEFATKYQPRSEQSTALIQSLDPSGSQMPVQLLKDRLKQWTKLRELFLSVAHHGKPNITVEELTEAIKELEEFLLNLMSPEPIADLDDLDALIEQGEAE